jgi:tetratricopeptide (TPR) repeat protein
MTRLEKLQEMLKADPKNQLASYGLAQELANLGRLEEATAQFERLLADHPDYCYGYFHGGRTLEKLGRLEEARAMWRRGLEAAARTGDQHAQSEIQQALDAI